jgi:hypothetical protein
MGKQPLNTDHQALDHGVLLASSIFSLKGLAK